MDEGKVHHRDGEDDTESIRDRHLDRSVPGCKYLYERVRPTFKTPP